MKKPEVAQIVQEKRGRPYLDQWLPNFSESDSQFYC